MSARRVSALVLALAMCLVATSSLAATHRVDDSASLPVESTALLRWRQSAPSRSTDAILEGGTTVAVRLNLAPWLDRQARLYLVLPMQGSALTKARWQTQGRLLPGEISPGQRVIVYQGPITTPFLEETLSIGFEADGNRLPGTERLEFHFEIDTE